MRNCRVLLAICVLFCGKVGGGWARIARLARVAWICATSLRYMQVLRKIGEALGSIPGTERGGRAGLDARRRGGGQQPDAPVCVCGRAS